MWDLRWDAGGEGEGEGGMESGTAWDGDGEVESMRRSPTSRCGGEVE